MKRFLSALAALVILVCAAGCALADKPEEDLPAAEIKDYPLVNEKNVMNRLTRNEETLRNIYDGNPGGFIACFAVEIMLTAPMDELDGEMMADLMNTGTLYVGIGGGWLYGGFFGSRGAMMAKFRNNGEKECGTWRMVTMDGANQYAPDLLREFGLAEPMEFKKVDYNEFLEYMKELYT